MSSPPFHLFSKSRVRQKCTIPYSLNRGNVQILSRGLPRPTCNTCYNHAKHPTTSPVKDGQLWWECAKGCTLITLPDVCDSLRPNSLARSTGGADGTDPLLGPFRHFGFSARLPYLIAGALPPGHDEWVGERNGLPCVIA